MILLQENMMLGRKPAVSPIEGIIIAGGAIRGWFNSEESPDIDVFASSVEALQEFKKENLGGYRLVYSTDNADTYKKGEVLVQLIKKIYPKSVPELFEHFDFHLCQFAYTLNPERLTKGNPPCIIHTTLEAVLSVTRKRLTVNKFLPGFGEDSLRRAFKYAEKGYKPCNGTIKDLFREITLQEEQTASIISPGGILRFD